jgi:AbrB family looped-hinge helix DNA binding protein
MSVKFKMKIVKVGNSLRVTIPKEIVEAVRLRAGDSVNISLEGNQIVIGKIAGRNQAKTQDE